MPGGDRTGPRGLGVMTGRGAGFCIETETDGYINPVSGRGFKIGRGRPMRMGRCIGRGFRNCFYAIGMRGMQRPVSNENFEVNSNVKKEQELVYLKKQIFNLENSIKDINKRVKELKGSDS